MSVLSVLSVLSLSTLIIVFTLLIVSHLLFAIGLYKMATNRKLEFAWLSWIPIANLYILGCITGPLDFMNNPEIILPLGAVLTCICFGIPVLGVLISLVFAMLYYFCLDRIFRKYDVNNAVLYTIVSIVFHIESVFIFILKDKKYLG